MERGGVGVGGLRCKPFCDRSPGAALPELAWCVFHLGLSSLGEEVAALGYAGGRPSDSRLSGRARQRVRARAPGGGCGHLPVHICPRLCLPPSPRPLLGGGPWKAGGRGQSRGMAKQGRQRPRRWLPSPALGRQGCRFFVPPRSPSFVFLTCSWPPNPKPERGVCA